MPHHCLHDVPDLLEILNAHFFGFFKRVSLLRAYLLWGAIKQQLRCIFEHLEMDQAAFQFVNLDFDCRLCLCTLHVLLNVDSGIRSERIESKVGVQLESRRVKHH